MKNLYVIKTLSELKNLENDLKNCSGVFNTESLDHADSLELDMTATSTYAFYSRIYSDIQNSLRIDINNKVADIEYYIRDNIECSTCKFLILEACKSVLNESSNYSTYIDNRYENKSIAGIVALRGNLPITSLKHQIDAKLSEL